MRKKIGVYHLSENLYQCVVWAPFLNSIDLEIMEPEPAVVPLEVDDRGYWHATTDLLKEGSLYYFNLGNGRRRPDPASRFQPQGVHGPSQVVSPDQLRWTDGLWSGIAPRDMIIYELHTGTFTPEGTFESAIPRLDYLKEVGVNAIEIMPVAQFPGSRNWGYDGVYPFATQESYGGASGLVTLVEACHRRGIAVILDVVYNHMGPEGNYLEEFGPYFTEKYKTPWGKAVNFDDAHSDEVRNYFIQNALMWLRDFHVDALRLDAVHAIKDLGARHFLQELSEETKKLSEELGVKKYLIGECDLNDARYILPPKKGGYGLDAQWNDEFHHALHTLITDERTGYYEDFGEISHLESAYKDTFVYSGQYSPHRKRTFGGLAENTTYDQFVVFSQNHDQVGNRMLGKRLTQLVSFEALKLAAGAVFISPNIPLLFMGEEYGEKNPFLYFVSHTDENLVAAVREGRRNEFKDFHGEAEAPDPQSPETFTRSKLSWDLENEQSKSLLSFYKTCIQFRKEIAAFKNYEREGLEAVSLSEKVLAVTRKSPDSLDILAVMNFSSGDASVQVNFSGRFKKILDSADAQWLGPGPASPGEVNGPEEIRLRGSNIVIYQKTNLK